jgi:hypothetical protein
MGRLDRASPDRTARWSSRKCAASIAAMILTTDVLEDNKALAMPPGGMPEY